MSGPCKNAMKDLEGVAGDISYRAKTILNMVREDRDRLTSG